MVKFPLVGLVCFGVFFGQGLVRCRNGLAHVNGCQLKAHFLGTFQGGPRQSFIASDPGQRRSTFILGIKENVPICPRFRLDDDGRRLISHGSNPLVRFNVVAFWHTNQKGVKHNRTSTIK